MKISHVPRATIDIFLSVYQKTISPDHGAFKHFWPHGFCPKSPSCSAYARKLIREQGIVRGIPLSLWRVMKCNPWSKPDEKRLQELAKQVLSKR